MISIDRAISAFIGRAGYIELATIYQEGTIAAEIFESKMRGFRKAWGVSPLMHDDWKLFREWDLSEQFVRHAEDNMLPLNPTL